MKISVIISAHNEEKYIGHCIASVKKASEKITEEVEIVVVINRCDDRTEDIAKAAGAKLVYENGRNIARIRNAGLTNASGDVLATIDADSIMSETLLYEIVQEIKSDKYVGGGVRIKPERMSMGILVTGILFYFMLMRDGISVGVFWCQRKYYEAIGGFNEDFEIVEDLDFAKRLKKYGEGIGKKFKRIDKAHIVTSCRKFDKYGDWHMLDMLLFKRDLIKGAVTESNKNFVNRYYFDFNNTGKHNNLNSYK